MEMVSKKFVCVALLCMVVMSATVPRGAEAALGCGQVVGSLAPCMTYLTGGPLAGGCCPGIQKLLALAKTTPDRQSACNCLKSAAKSYKNLDLSKAAGLPGACKVNIPYKISPSTDCSKYINLHFSFSTIYIHT